MENSKINLATGAPAMPMPANYELMPLKKRLMLLMANRFISFDSDPETGVPVIAGGKGSQSQSGCSTEEKLIETISTKERENGGPVGYKKQRSQAPNLMISSQTVATSVRSSSLHQLSSPKNLDTLEFGKTGKRKENLSNCQRSGTSLTEYQKAKLESEMSAEELDHLPLTVRLTRLLSRKTLGLMEAPLEGSYSAISPSSATSLLQIAQIGSDMKFGGQKNSMDNSCNVEIHMNSESESSKRFAYPSGKTTCASKSLCAEDSSGFKRNDRMHSSKKKHSKGESHGRNARRSAEIRTVQNDAAPKWPNIKTEPPNYNDLQKCNQLALAPMVDIKVEPLNYSELQLPNATPVGPMSSMILTAHKTEVDTCGDYGEDKLDHLLLRERMGLLSPKNDPGLNVSQDSKCTDHIGESSLNFKQTVPTLKINRLRKRRKTVTDSIETAMEEDAPGLLKVLIDKGVSVNEIKLYGEPESDDAVDDTQSIDGFAELEEVIAKLFCRRESFMKGVPMRSAKVEKASYCLECLFSLVEQARYLQFRNWPVEWGWCRDLQSFIFVFERHHRIVLERPEYGYATYFFELAESLPIDWQVKRLVIAMKLTNCSRITIIENKALKVGDELSEGEAEVLLQYGWTPDTGLGTMLNYYDRVVHDRKSEKDGSEWRSKIGKLLMDGYNGGTFVSTSIPSKVVEYNMAHPVPIKMEVEY